MHAPIEFIAMCADWRQTRRCFFFTFFFQMKQWPLIRLSFVWTLIAILDFQFVLLLYLSAAIETEHRRIQFISPSNSVRAQKRIHMVPTSLDRFWPIYDANYLATSMSIIQFIST